MEAWAVAVIAAVVFLVVASCVCGCCCAPPGDLGSVLFDTIAAPTKQNTFLLNGLDNVLAAYRPVWCLRHWFVNTLFAVAKPSPRPPTLRFFVGEAEVDVLEPNVYWPVADPGCKLGTAPDGAPTLIIVPGIGGGIDSPTGRDTMRHAYEMGWRSVLVTHRGCGEVPLRHRQSFTWGVTTDLESAVRFVIDRYPNTTIFGAGFSMGSNQLLKFMGTVNEDPESDLYHALSGAFSYSNAFFLKWGYDMFANGKKTIKMGEQAILENAKKGFKKAQPELQADPAVAEMLSAGTIEQFDRLHLSNSFGHENFDAAVEDASCGTHIHRITRPVVSLLSRDDPIYPDEVEEFKRTMPLYQPNLIFMISSAGGHIGWYQHMMGSSRYRSQRYLSLKEQLISHFGPKMLQLAQQHQLPAEPAHTAPQPAEQAVWHHFRDSADETYVAMELLSDV
eukprot:m.98863 g.98863  ORF g.98863 m.98863 type:complete len:447 (-) comp15302_c1_seq1:320-1660(-)